MRCIYCKNEITDVNSSKEHVFPDSFGCPDHWVLDCVCEPCNNKFGGSIDRWLASDSLEGIKRLQILGSKSKKPVMQRRVRTTLPKEARYGPWQGAVVWLDFSRKDNIVFPPQLGFLNEKGEREYYAVEEFDIPPIKTRIKSLSNKDVRILAPSKEKYQETINLLLEKGIVDNPPANEEPAVLDSAADNDRIVFEARGDIDRDIQRAMAKIAFNYLAKVQGCEYGLKENFDEIRSFINGELRKPLVTPSKKPILYEDSEKWRRFKGHLFVVERVNDHLISKVSLFNGITYHVLLSKDIGPFWYPVRSGHAFDVEALRLLNMFPSSIIR